MEELNMIWCCLERSFFEMISDWFHCGYYFLSKHTFRKMFDVAMIQVSAVIIYLVLYLVVSSVILIVFK